MSLGFPFNRKIDPENPLDLTDPPPENWDTGIDTRDCRANLHGSPSELFTRCLEWEKREMERLNSKMLSTEQVTDLKQLDRSVTIFVIPRHRKRGEKLEKRKYCLW
ncbi:hypothetical protein ACFLY0_02120 [Patescibacteria group bacterium]